MNCQICKRIEMIKENSNPFFIKEFKECYAVFSDHQQFQGTIFLYAKNHIENLYDLEEEHAVTFFKEIINFQKVMRKAFNVEHVDCEIIGDNDKHLYVQLFPRMDQDLPLYGDSNGNGPVYWCPKSRMYASDNVPNSAALASLKSLIEPYLNEIDN